MAAQYSCDDANVKTQEQLAKVSLPKRKGHFRNIRGYQLKIGTEPVQFK